MSFKYLSDGLFLIAVSAYAVNFLVERFGGGNTLTQGYLNDLICLPFWMPILTYGLRRLRLRSHDRPPQPHEMLTAFAVWAFLFEVHFPNSQALKPYTYADPWDVVSYAAGGVLTWIWWQWVYSSSTTPIGSNAALMQP